MSIPGHQTSTLQSYNRNSLETIILEHENKGYIKVGKVYVTTGTTGKPLYNQLMKLPIRTHIGRIAG